MRGRKPKPTRLKVLHGTRQSRINEEQPTVPGGRPQCPRELNDSARAIWDDLCENLRRLGMLSPCYGPNVALISDALARTFEAADHVNREGAVIEDRDGQPRRNPWVMVLSQERAALSRLLSELGFTPASMTRIKGGADVLTESANTRKASGVGRFMR